MDRCQVNLALTDILKRMAKPEVAQKVQTARRTPRSAPAGDQPEARKTTRTRSKRSR
jgi:hypothetical protein